MDHIDIIARAVIRRDDAILLCRHISRSNYFLPGGHVEFGETFETALIRELAEELGATISDLHFLLVHENRFTQDGEAKHEINILFTANIDTTRTESEEDHLAFEWVQIASLPNTELFPIATRDVLIRFFADNVTLPPENTLISSV